MKMQKTTIALVLVWLPLILAMTDNSSAIDHRGCPTKCGNLTVEYPFGIGVGDGCSISPWYEVNCSTAFNPPKPFLARTNAEIIEILDTGIRIKTSAITSRCYNQSDGATTQNTTRYRLYGDGPFSFSSENMFIAVGCDDVSYMEREDTGSLISSCTAICSQKEDLVDGACSGIGCCENSIPKGAKDFITSLKSNGNHSQVLSFNRCGYTFLAEKGSYRFRSADVLDDPGFEQRILETIPLVLDWVIGNQTCEEARKSDQFACKENSVCVDFDTRHGGYHCKCSDGYKGNPYLSPGCLR